MRNVFFSMPIHVDDDFISESFSTRTSEKTIIFISFSFTILVSRIWKNTIFKKENEEAEKTDIRYLRFDVLSVSKTK